MPNYVSPIAVIYNLEGVEDLQLSAGDDRRDLHRHDHLVGRPGRSRAENPDATLPATAIVPVHRSDDSGTTDNFTDYLSATAAEVWTSEPDGVWPLQSGEGANGSSGVVDAVTAGDGYIGYVDLSRAGDLGVVRGEGRRGVRRADPRGRGGRRRRLRAGRRPRRVRLRHRHRARHHRRRARTRSSWCRTTWPAPTYEDQETADVVKAFLSYVVSEEGQQAAVRVGRLRTDLRRRPHQGRRPPSRRSPPAADRRQVEGVGWSEPPPSRPPAPPHTAAPERIPRR